MVLQRFIGYNELLSTGILGSQSNIVQYCMDTAILRDQQTCEKCSNTMILKDCPTSQYSDNFYWYCPSTTDHQASIRRNSILSGKRISLTWFLSVLSHFSKNLSVSQTAKEDDLQYSTVKNIYDSIRNCMAEDLLQNTDTMIGGPGTVVEIYESLFGKRKYNRGRQVRGTRILGGIERGSNKCFLVECTNNRRDHHTLLALIKQYIRPGTTIISDCWAGYRFLEQHGYRHVDVNLSRNFVDPLTGAHTNTVESQ